MQVLRVEETQKPLTGFELKILRLRQGLKQYQVAAKVGITPTRLCEIELGRQIPSAQILERLLEVVTDKSSDDGDKDEQEEA